MRSIIVMLYDISKAFLDCDGNNKSFTMVDEIINFSIINMKIMPQDVKMSRNHKHFF